MINERNLFDLAQEHHKKLLREAEQERLLRFAMANREPRQSLAAHWIISLGKTLITWIFSYERSSDTAIEVDVLP